MTEAEDCRRGASGGIGKMPTAECTSGSGDQHFTQRLRTAIASAIPLSVRAMVIRPKHAPEHSIDPRPELSPLLDALDQTMAVAAKCQILLRSTIDRGSAR